MRHKKAHVKAVGDVIEQRLQQADEAGVPFDIDELAEDVIEAYRAKLDAEKAYVGVARLPVGEQVYYRAFGPYTTPKQAEKALAAIAAPGPEGGLGRVVEVQKEPPV